MQTNTNNYVYGCVWDNLEEKAIILELKDDKAEVQQVNMDSS